MNWKLKAFLQKTIDLVPKSNELNYFFQKNITKKLPVPEWMFIAMVKEADFHFSALLKYQKCFKQVAEVRHYEFGSGWDMIVPLSYARFGITKQKLIDLHFLLKLDLIENTVQRLKTFSSKELKNQFLVDLDLKRYSPTVLENKIGILYEAPKDASNTTFKDDTFHFSSSTNVLEHVPKKDIVSILKETFRILKKGGIFTFRIDYSDHYSYFDTSISIYNFLQFSDKEWRKYDHSLQPQTRIRHSEMLQYIEKTEFEIVEVKKHIPTYKNMEVLKSIKLAKQFEDFDLEELAIGWAYIILRKN